MLPRSLHNVLHAARDYLTPTLKSTQFLEKGQLTPEEFVHAGDYLVRLSPGWVWCSGEERVAKSYLPPDKQFLVSRGCICRYRASTLDVSGEEKDEGEGWTTAGVLEPAEEYADMAGDDLAKFMDATVAAVHDPGAAMFIPDIRDDGDRLYDIHIVYDNAYRTPRIYLLGFVRGCGIPLRSEAMMEDLMQDYISKTATLEKHPHLTDGMQYVSIHPCRHAQTMKRLVDEMSTVGGAPSIQLYMFIFLKFISSVIPTIEYDLTVAVSVSA